MKQFLIIVAMVCFTNFAKANDTIDLDEYIADNYLKMPVHIQNEIDNLLTYGDRFKAAIFAIIHNQLVYDGNPSCHDWEEA